MRIMRCFLCGGWPHYFLKLLEEGVCRGRCWALPSDIQGHMKIVGSCVRRSLYLTLGSFSFLSVVNHWNRLPREVTNAWSLPVFKRHLYDALRNVLYLLVGPEVVRQLDKMIVVGRYILAEIFKSRIDFAKKKKNIECICKRNCI